METTMYIFKPDGDHDVLEVDLARDPGYIELKKLVEPLLSGGMERVTVKFQDKVVDMFVDEIGLLKGLPRNEAATMIYRKNTLDHNPEMDPEELSFIAGVAVVFNRPVWF